MESARANVFISAHPLIKTKVALMRDVGTDSRLFRGLVREVGVLLGYEATCHLSLKSSPKTTGNFGEFVHHEVAENVAIVPILRAGLGLVDSMLELLPNSPVLHLGIFREKVSLQPVEYYNKLPRDNPPDVCFVLDPMIATGGTCIAAVDILKGWGVRKIKLVSICASPEGLDTLHRSHPDVEVYLAALDDRLNDKAYIIPGLGDAGDRLFGTYH